jgi:hypothetical protein
VSFITLMVAAGILEHGTNSGGYIFMEPLLFLALDHLMEVFGWGSLTSSWLDDCACWLAGLLTCACLVNRPLVAYLMAVEHAISLWCGFWCTCLSWMCYILLWMMCLAPQGLNDDGVTR